MVYRNSFNIYQRWMVLFVVFTFNYVQAGNDSLGNNASKKELITVLIQLQNLGYCQQPIKNVESTIFPFDLDKNYHTLSNGKFLENSPAASCLSQESDCTIIKHSMDFTIFALSIDPLAAKYASLSPYNAMENDPINRIDPDGRSSVRNNRHGYESPIVSKWIDYLRVFHSDEYSQEEIASKYLQYTTTDPELEDEVEEALLDQIQLDVASGKYQKTRALQMKEFREKRKELVPIETLIPKNMDVSAPIQEAEPIVPVVETVENPLSFLELSKMTPKEQLITDIESIENNIRLNQHLLEALSKHNTGLPDPIIEMFKERINSGLEELAKKRMELKEEYDGE